MTALDPSDFAHDDEQRDAAGRHEDPPSLPERKLSILVTEERNFGDHGDRCVTAIDHIPGESVEDLVVRAFGRLTQTYSEHNFTDEITIRVIDTCVKEDGLYGSTKVAADPWAPTKPGDSEQAPF